MLNRSRYVKDMDEAGDMIVSQPGPALAVPNPLELLARELEKYRDMGWISPIIYARSRDLLPLLRTPLLNIYTVSNRDLRPALSFLLGQANK